MCIFFYFFLFTFGLQTEAGCPGCPGNPLCVIRGFCQAFPKKYSESDDSMLAVLTLGGRQAGSR